MQIMCSAIGIWHLGLGYRLLRSQKCIFYPLPNPLKVDKYYVDLSIILNVY